MQNAVYKIFMLYELIVILVSLFPVIYSLETESWKWHGIGLFASEALAKQVWYAETYSFDTTLATMFCTNCNLCNWYLSKPYNSALQKSSFNVTNAWTATAAVSLVRYFLILDMFLRW